MKLFLVEAISQNSRFFENFTIQLSSFYAIMCKHCLEGFPILPFFNLKQIEFKCILNIATHFQLNRS